MAKDYMKKLLELEGAVTEGFNPHIAVVRTASPSTNFIFGNGWGLPQGYTGLFYGPPKSGKSLLAYAYTGQLHQDDPEAIVIKFNTELREKAQYNPVRSQRIWGIDPKRYIPYDVNDPALIFDRIENEIAALCDDGAKIKFIIIDSLNNIKGRRSMNADSVMVQQRGDDALTIQTGLKRILDMQRKHNIAFMLTSHVRAEQDEHEIMRGNKVRPGVSWATSHFAEYYVYVEQDKTKDGKTNLLGEKFEDDTVADLNDNAERTGHKIRVTMKDSSLGPKGRAGEFTLDYDKGIINTHEEVFLLGVGRNVIEKPNNLSYAFGERKWVGKPAMLEALRSEKELQDTILTELRRRDLAGLYDESTAE
jgi:hypothetical protein